MPNVMAALPNTGIMCYSVRWGPAVLKDVAMATNFGTNRGPITINWLCVAIRATEPTTQTASRSVQPFLQGSLV